MKSKKVILLSPVLTLAVFFLAFAVPVSINPTHAKSAKTDLPETATCPKCQGQMERGYSMDWSDTSANNGFGQSEWGMSLPSNLPFAKIPKNLKVFTYRCTNCGYLESYAK
jgi:rubredoxin